MFYEKLAESKEEKKRLSTKQKIGVGLAGTAGLGAGTLSAIGGLNLGSLLSDRVDRYYDVTVPRRFFTTVGAGGLLGAGIATYGAKKLYDQHNELKRLRED
jgi:hypothetical protein